MHYDGKIASSTLDIVNLFADHFQSVYEGEISDNNVPSYTYPNTIHLQNFFITRESCLNKITSLDPNKSAGPDNIPPIFLKQCASAISGPLTTLFNHLLSSGHFPARWKSSYITPIFKKGDDTDIKNYRPICIQSALPKIFEALVLDLIYPSILKVIDKNQHGFVSGRSTATNLLLYHNYITESFAKKKQVDSIYTDFSKAFDKVSHKLLLSKLYALGLRGKLLDWFSSYLSNRILFVKIKHSKSKLLNATSGLPQGSHLGPILFLIFINDIISCFDDVEVLLFADDIKLYKQISNIGDCLILQSNINKLQNWCVANNLFLNIDKCKTLTFCRTKTPLSFKYTIENKILEKVKEIRDLGVMFDTQLNFINHIQQITNKGMKTLGFIIRTIKDFDSLEVIKIVYLSLVRSLLEFNSIIWSPYYQIHIRNIERVQHKFLRFINFKLHIPIQHINYTSLLNTLKLHSLENRRKIIDLTFLFKIIHSKLDCCELLHLIDFKVPNRETRQNILFCNNNSGTNYHIHAPISRLHTLGNKFTSNIDIFNTSLPLFKKYLNDIFM